MGCLEIKEDHNGLTMWYTTTAGELFFMPISPLDVEMAKGKLAEFLAANPPKCQPTSK